MTAMVAGWTAAVAAAGVAWLTFLRLAWARELAARASHEVRGPLTAAQLALDAMAARGELPADRAAALDVQLRRARLAVEDLAGDAPDAHEAVTAASVIAQLALTWRPVLAARDRELRLVAPIPSGVLWADPLRLAQALGNLMANALEHGAGAVELRARVHAGRLSIEVRDEGAGLPGPVDALARRPEGARGRGLAIAAAVAERHGGRLHAAPSPAGAALVLELPLAAAAIPPAEDHP